jgi:hypothetical protein
MERKWDIGQVDPAETSSKMVDLKSNISLIIFKVIEVDKDDTG